MIRRLDRYVLGIFIPALFLFTVTLLFLFVSVDFASKLGKFMELKNVPVLPFILHYYLVRIPMFLTILIPAAMLFAPSFTVIKLARTNEILPIVASGTSLRRMSLPFVAAALLGCAGMAAMDEFILPRIGEEIAETDQQFNDRGWSYNVEDYDGRTKIWAKRFDPALLLLSEQVRVTRLDDSMQPVEVITAKRALWDPQRKRWVAYDGFVERPFEIERIEGEKPRTWKRPIPPEGYVVESDLKPDGIRKTTGLSTRFAFARMKALLQDMRLHPRPTSIMRVHSRLSFPLSPLVLLLVGLPFVMDPQAKSFIKGLIFCFLLALGYYLTHFACVDMGTRGSIPPLVGAWFPTAAFGLPGIVAFTRMRT